jgi:hypothetical protein
MVAIVVLLKPTHGAYRQLEWREKEKGEGSEN